MTDLNERIAQLLDADPETSDPDEIAQTLRNVRSTLIETQAELNQTRETALDPGTSIVGASRAHEHLGSLEFRLERLMRASERLSARFKDAIERETEKVAAAKRQLVIERRDELVAKVREDYPRLAGALIDLLSEMASLDVECARVKVPTCETIVRDYQAPPNGGQVFALCNAVQLPALPAGSPLWPPPAPTHTLGHDRGDDRQRAPGGRKYAQHRVRVGHALEVERQSSRRRVP